MSELQFSTKAQDFAHVLARRTGQPINKLVEQALKRYDHKLWHQDAQSPAQALWDLMAERQARPTPPARCRIIATFCDERGLPL